MNQLAQEGVQGEAPRLRRIQGEEMPDDEGIVKLPVDGVLDLHTVHPRDADWLVPDYIAACRRKGILFFRAICAGYCADAHRTGLPARAAKRLASPSRAATRTACAFPAGDGYHLWVMNRPNFRK